MRINQLILLFIVFLVFAGCSEPADPMRKPKQNRAVTAKAANLLNAEQKALSLHLDWTGSGAITFANPSNVTASYELWQNGEVVDPGGTFPSTYPAENVSFALRPSTRELGNESLSISFNFGDATMMTDIIGLPTDSVALGDVQLIGIDELVIQPGEKKAVWGYAATEVGNVSPGSEEELKQSPWGLIVYIEAAE